MNLIMNTLGRCVKPLFGTGVGRIPGVVFMYKWLWSHFGPRGVIEVTANGYTLAMNCNDWAMMPSLLFSHIWETKETCLVKQCVKSGMIVVDIGAHVGYYSLLLSNLVGDTGSVHTFEPSPDTAKLLTYNLAQSGVKNVSQYTCAISNHIGIAEMWIDGYSPASNSLWGKKHNHSVIVELKTLDSMLVGPINFIKMDIEGGECNALDGMVNVIKNSPNLIMLTEVYPEGLKRAGSSLREYILKLRRYFDLFDMDSKLTDIYGIEHTLKRAGSINLICRRLINV